MYSIGEFSRLTGLGIHTLRYYERERLLVPKRNAANRRRYGEDDLAWTAFLKRLKATGMPIRDIRRYAALRALGEATLEARLALLAAHRETLRRHLRALGEHMAKLDEKIGWYETAIRQAAVPDAQSDTNHC